VARLLVALRPVSATSFVSITDPFFFSNLTVAVPVSSLADLIQNILENLVDGYDRDFISVASDRVDTRPPRALSARD